MLLTATSIRIHNQFCILEWLSNGMVQVFDWNLAPTSPEMHAAIYGYKMQGFFKAFIKPSTGSILDI